MFNKIVCRAITTTKAMGSAANMEKDRHRQIQNAAQPIRSSNKVIPVSSAIQQRESFEKCSFLFKFKEGENFNHRNTLSI
ncbi:MAG: hypothetical protein ACTSRA_09345 [Promethearchaeota archaeon]